ncbi:energy transducer TonB [Alteriqipengyuania flavescens]|uniref:energy transducer TonB n=1 Tax=Alteriqipengyuania flavescens TaxID=3053610 RepID=UPI0025B59925|nr:energy transducer TonB [Alteriqipengyuania flavescens]WJY17875.1 energy transducer TonB [Alteriqipengyuania flavescens]WJY23816.1 energy transducer TonB [Alteriqipengyuania flavescens]
MRKSLPAVALPLAFFVIVLPAGALGQERAGEPKVERKTAPVPPPSEVPGGVSPHHQGRWARSIQENYPAAALRNLEEGNVRLRVTVNTDGRVDSCTLTTSNGSAALDTAACDGMVRFAQFNPALDLNGEPVASNCSTAIRYQIPQGNNVLRLTGPVPLNFELWAEDLLAAIGIRPDMPPAPVAIVTNELQINRAGRIASCRAEIEEPTETSEAELCAALRKHAVFEPALKGAPELRDATFPLLVLVKFDL